MLFTECNGEPYFFNAPEYLVCDVRAAGPVAKIFRELFFMAIRARHPRLNCHVRHGVTNFPVYLNSCGRDPVAQVTPHRPRNNSNNTDV